MSSWYHPHRLCLPTRGRVVPYKYRKALLSEPVSYRISRLIYIKRSIPLPIFVWGNTRFFTPVFVEKICLNGFFLTEATGRLFCEGSEPLFVTDALAP